MTPAERQQHMLSVIEDQICAEAWKVSQYEGIDAETATDAQARWDDWALLRDAVSQGLIAKLAAEKHEALADVAAADVDYLEQAARDGGLSAGLHAAREVAHEITRRALAGSAVAS